MPCLSPPALRLHPEQNIPGSKDAWGTKPASSRFILSVNIGPLCRGHKSFRSRLGLCSSWQRWNFVLPYVPQSDISQILTIALEYFQVPDTNLPITDTAQPHGLHSVLDSVCMVLWIQVTSLCWQPPCSYSVLLLSPKLVFKYPRNISNSDGW